MGSRESLVDLIFTKCALVYGRDFLSRWEGLNLDEVKADWARELGGLLGSPHAIAYGLERLPADRPPNVLQFRALCVGAPGDAPRLALGNSSTTAEESDPAGKARIAEMLANTKRKLLLKAPT